MVKKPVKPVKPEKTLEEFMEGINKKSKQNGLKIRFGFTKRKR